MSKTTRRDQNIQKAYAKEIDLQTRVVKPKKAYKRKEKYKSQDY
jgi:hypothetical protein